MAKIPPTTNQFNACVSHLSQLSRCQPSSRDKKEELPSFYLSASTLTTSCLLTPNSIFCSTFSVTFEFSLSRTMMKLLLSLVFVAGASAFSPLFQAPKSSTQLHTVDPNAVSHFAKQGVDAESVLFLDCDNHDCAIVEAHKERDGWHFENKLGGAYESPSAGHTSRILMMKMEDTE